VANEYARYNNVRAIVLETPLWVILRTDVASIGCGELEVEQRDAQNDEQSERSVRCMGRDPVEDGKNKMVGFAGVTARSIIAPWQSLPYPLCWV
jgi:hypothetical protein